MKSRIAWRALGALFLAPALLPADARACCTAFPPGAFVQIADQEIAVVWDAKAKREHFIRRAGFRTQSTDFGFLVPTPGMPELAEASDDLFVRLGKAIEPERVTRKVLKIRSILMPTLASATKSLPADSVSLSAVTVLLEQRVAGYDAVVLEARDPLALAGWLKERGYATRPELADWLAPYVEMRWKITAFKLAVPEAGAPGNGARYAVRMSFDTERPLFPFRTPADQSADGPGGNLLRIFFVGASRAEGSLGDAAWEAKVPYSRRREDLPALLGDAVPAGSGLSEGWLTAFEDRAWPRRSESDLYFKEGPGAEVVPPPIVIPKEVIVPLELVGGAFAVAIIWLLRRRSGQATA